MPPLDSLATFLAPTALALAFGWNVAVLASIQLSVRLIRAFSVRTTLLGAAALTAATVPITVAYHGLARTTPGWLPIAMLLTAGAGFVVSRWVLRLKRARSRFVAAVGIGILSGPWGAFLARPPT